MTPSPMKPLLRLLILAATLASTRAATPDPWPALPVQNASVLIPAQE